MGSREMGAKELLEGEMTLEDEEEKEEGRILEVA